MGGYAPEGLLEWAAKIMERCNQQGMRLPYILCFISPNGSILTARMSLDQPNPPFWRRALELVDSSYL
jgi:hypothetical protein